MRRILLLSIMVLAVFSCAQDQPAGPEDSVVTFDRYDAESNFEGTATAWYCSTNAQFAFAKDNYSVGDIIYLANDDTLFCVMGDTHIYGASIVGLDENRSKIKTNRMESGLSIVQAGGYPSIVLSNIEIIARYLSLSICSDTCFVNNITVYNQFYGEDNYVGGSEYSSGTIILTDCYDIFLNFAGYPYGPVDVWGIQWDNANDVCDVAIYTDPETVNIHTWIYDDKTYSYDALTIIGSKQEACEYCDGGDDVNLYVQFAVNGAQWGNNEDEIAVWVRFGESAGSLNASTTACFSSSEWKWQAYLDCDEFAPDRGDTIYWQAHAALCDKEITSSVYSYTIPSKAPLLCSAPAWYGCD
jgi:hypothetical protein